MDEKGRSRLRVGKLLVEPTRDLISREGQSGCLRPQVMELLLFMAAHPGEVVSSQTLLSTLWSGKVVTDGTVYNCIAELRQAIAALDDSQPYIETIPKRGYRLVADVHSAEHAQAVSTEPRRRWHSPAITLAVVLLCAVLAGYFSLQNSPSAARSEAVHTPLQRFTIEIPPDMSSFDIQYRPVRISPDGQRIIILGKVQERTQLYARALEDITMLPIKGTEDAASAFALSPDGEWLAFTRQGDTGLWKVRAGGGVPIQLCDPGGRIWGLSWNSAELILFDSVVHDGLMSVSALGGEPRQVSFPAEGEVHKHPHLLRDGKSVLLTVGSRGPTMRDSDTLASLSLETGEVKTLMPGASPTVTEDGLLVYFRDDALWAARFDAARSEITGTSVPVADDIHYETEAHYSLSRLGTIVYVINTNFTPRELVWVDLDGKETMLPFEPQPYLSPRVAPDGRQVAVIVDAPGGADLWVYSIDESVRVRLTRDQSREASPVWQRDGSALIYSSDRIDNLYRRQVDGVNTVELLLESPDYLFAYSTTTGDGQVLYTQVDTQVLPGSPGDLGSLDLDSRLVRRLSSTNDRTEFEPAISEDGNLLAFSSLRDGRREVYVRDMRASDGASWRVSSDGGSQPLWNPATGDLLFWGPEAIMSVSLGLDGKPETRPMPLVTHEKYVYYDVRNYDISPDGRRLLLVKNSSSSAMPTNQVVLAQNWLNYVAEEIRAHEGQDR